VNEGAGDDITDERRAEVESCLRAIGPYTHAGDPLGFSWSACQCCGSADGGERHELHVLSEEESPVVIVHPDIGELTEPWLLDDVRSYGALLCTQCRRADLLKTNLSYSPVDSACCKCQRVVQTLTLWIHPEHATWAQTAPCEE
jgi:hypothetical protein